MTRDLLRDPGGNGEPANCLYAWIVVHGDGDEAIAGMNGMPMIVATYANAIRLRNVASRMRELSGKPIKLVRYDIGDTLEGFD